VGVRKRSVSKKKNKKLRGRKEGGEKGPYSIVGRPHVVFDPQLLRGKDIGERREHVKTKKDQGGFQEAGEGALLQNCESGVPLHLPRLTATICEVEYVVKGQRNYEADWGGKAKNGVLSRAKKG